MHWVHPLLVVVGLVAPVLVCGQCSDDLPTCSYYPDNDLPEPRVNSSVEQAGGVLCIIGGVNSTGCGAECFLDDVFCLDPTESTKWISGYDPVPKGYTLVGSDFAAPVGADHIAVIVAARFVEPGAVIPTDAVPLQMNFLIFNPGGVSGSQWSVYDTVLPYPKARVSIVGYSGYVYLLGGVEIDEDGAQTPNTSSFRWLETTPNQIEEIEPVPLNTVGFGVAANSEFIYVLGGMGSDGVWGTDMYRYYPLEDRWEIIPYGAPRVPYVNSVMFGGAMYVFGDNTDGGSELNLFVWSEATVSWSQLVISSFPGPRRGMAICPTNPFAGVATPRIYIFGGLNVGTGEVGVSVGHLTTGIDLPRVTITPQEIRLNEQFEISFSSMVPMDIYQIRISTHIDCSDRLQWLPDFAYPDPPTYTLSISAEEPLPRAYVCFSRGGCPTTVQDAVPCRNNVAKSAAMCYGDCCAGISPYFESCWDMIKAGPFISLTTTPFTILNENFTTGTEVVPEDDTTEEPMTLYLVLISCTLGCALLVLLTAIIVRRFYPKPPTAPDSRYEMISQLGQGAYGVVYLVKRRVDGKLLAMKYIACRSSAEQQEAIQEFTTIKKLQGHPNMIKVIETTMNWVDDEQPSDATPLVAGHVSVASQRYVCLVMPYYPEGDLKGYIVAKKFIPYEEILNYVGQLASVLSYMHNSTPPLVHRDLKPENVLIDGNGSKLIITDFGLARSVGIASYCQTQAGTLTYIAPECWERKYGTEVDLWALGCITYGMATNRVEQHNTRMMFTDAMRMGPEKFKVCMRSDLEERGYPPHLAHVVTALLQVDYRQRPTAAEVMAMVGQVPGETTMNNEEEEDDDDEENFFTREETDNPLSNPVVVDVPKQEETPGVCGGCDVVLPKGLPRDFCCKICLKSGGVSHGPMCCSHSASRTAPQRQVRNINVESGRRCKGCSYEVTGLLPDYCCRRCLNQNGVHGLRCMKRPYMEPEGVGLITSATEGEAPEDSDEESLPSPEK